VIGAYKCWQLFALSKNSGFEKFFSFAADGALKILNRMLIEQRIHKSAINKAAVIVIFVK
jgi:hypothetical protein